MSSAATSPVSARGARSRLPIVCVFAKPPRPGAVKTRLAAAVGPRHAARLAAAFLEDTCAALRALPVRVVLATTEARGLAGLGAEVWLQGEGSLGERLERVLSRALESAPWAAAMGADSPGFPLEALALAERQLRDLDAVFGPAQDGGFYLVALRRCPAGCFDGVPWSSPETLRVLEARLLARGLHSARVTPWFDVDTVADLRRLARHITNGDVTAPATARAIEAGSRSPRDEEPAP